MYKPNVPRIIDGMATPMERVTAYFGSQKAAAKFFGLSQPCYWKWVHKQVPATRVLQIERGVNGTVTRHELRPDLYPIE